MWVMHPPPPAIFNEYNFSIILNLFDDNKPYALSTHNENVRTKCIRIGETLRIRGKKCKKNCLKTVQKLLKWPLHYAIF